MNRIYQSLTLAGAVLGATLFTSCDGSSSASTSDFNFNNARFSSANLANLGATASLPLYLVTDDEIILTPAGPTTSFDESYTPTTSRHGSILRPSGLNLVLIDRYQNATDQARFPALQTTWLAGENSVVGTLTSSDSINQSTLDQLTSFAANNADNGGVFSNPFGGSAGNLDGDVSQALAQAGLSDVNLSENKANFIVRELRPLGVEIFNNADVDAHDHGEPIDWIDPALRIITRRIFTFTATSTNADIVNNKQILGTYIIEEVFMQAYAHNELSGSEGYINLQLRGGSFSGKATIEQGTFLLKLQ